MRVTDFQIYTDKQIIECKKCKLEPLKMLQDSRGKGRWKAENVARHLKKCHFKLTGTALSVDTGDSTALGAMANPLDAEETSTVIATGSFLSPNSSDGDDTKEEPSAKVAKNCYT